MNRYAPDTIEKLHNILDGLDDDMPVEPTPDCGITATTVGALRQLTALPLSGITMTVPRPIFSESAVTICKRDPN
jgi:hypothetical protein